MNAPPSRRFLSLGLNKVLRLILSLAVHDCTGGFIALKRTVFDAIGEIKAKSGDFSFEIIYKAKLAGFTLTEIPFVYQWRTTGKSKTRIVKFGWEYLRSAISLKLHSFSWLLKHITEETGTAGSSQTPIGTLLFSSIARSETMSLLFSEFDVIHIKGSQTSSFVS